ncbi:MAG: MFS transporter [Sulfurospirillaceae bacterium]|jgi:MFS family permease|nr:MFS transporter [Sulfurospirillaceae bacterium]MCK9545437.1 MFS transporter [Sulfurospirillaceae bacterium]MDY0238802.1 MFS transporter [Campylobacterales bacterium]
MRTIILPIGSLFFAVALLSIGYGLLMSLIGIKMELANIKPWASGVVNASFFIGGVFSLISSIKIISTVGHIRSFAAFAALFAFAALWHTFTSSLIAWAITRAISGYSFYSLLLIVESWINEKTPSQNRGRVLSIYTVVFYISMTSGQLMLNIPDRNGTLLFTISAMFVMLSLIPIALTKIIEPRMSIIKTITLPRLYGIAKLAIVSSFIAGILVGGFFSMAPIFAKAINLSNSSISIFMSIALIGALLSQWPIGSFSDRFSRKSAILFTSFIGAVASMGLWLFGDSKANLFLFVFLLGVSIFAIYPLSLASGNDTTDESVSAIEINRALLLVYGIGSSISPILIGISMANFGAKSMFALFFAFSIFLTLYTYTRSKVPFRQRSIYVAVPSTTSPILAEFDPRQDEAWVEEKKEEIVLKDED